MKKTLHAFKSLLIGTILILEGANLNAQNICAASNTISPASVQNICIGSPAANPLTATITTSGSGNNGNITYTWYSNPTNSTTGGKAVQTLSTNSSTVSNTFTPPASVAGTLWYYCTVSNDGGDCAGTIYTTAAVQINVNTLPKIFNFSGGGSRCSNGPGLSISLNGTEIGVNYQLIKDGILSPTIFPGSGKSFGLVTTTGGTFTMIATNASSGCTSNMNGSAKIIINATPTASYSTTQVSCNGGDGSITVTAAGGTPSYLYNIDGGVFSSSNVFTGIASGNHSISVKDVNACIVNIAGISVQNAPPLSAKISIVNPGNCTGSDGSITANRVGGIDDGITPVQFKLDGDATMPYQNSNVFGGLSKGNYVITVKDSKGCTAVSPTVSLTQTAGTAPTIFNFTGGGTICSGGAGVSLSLNGSETGVNYQLQNGGVSVGTVLAGTGHPLNFYGNSPGTFTMVAINATAGCTSVMNGSAAITVNPLPKVFNFTVSSVRCSNASGIDLKLSGSEVGVNYQFIKNGITNPAIFPGNGNPLTLLTQDSTSTSITMLATNSTSGCTSLMSGSVNTTNIPRNPALTPSYTKYYASSCVGGDGTITITPGGGTPGYLYSVDGKAFGTNNFLTGLAAGDHQVVIKDANSCTFTYPAITILTAPIMKVETGGANPGICTGNDGAVWATELGGDVDGITPIQYMLNGDVTRPFQTSSTFTGLPIGNYTVTIKDSKGCLAQSNIFTLTLGTVISLNAYSINVSSCGNGMDGRISTTITGGVAPYTYKINGSIVAQSGSQYFEYSNLGVGNYTIEISDRSGCSVTREFSITQANAPVAEVAYNGNETCIGKNDGYISLASTGIGGIPGYSYSKDGGTTYQTSYSFTNLAPATYSMVVKDSKGCVSTPLSITVRASTVSCRMGNISGGNSTGNREAANGVNSNLSKTSFNSTLNIQAYPNPFGSEFTLNVQGNNQDRVSISITDVLGRKLYLVEGNANQQYKLGSNLKQGIYFVQVMQGDNVQTIKIVKE